MNPKSVVGPDGINGYFYQKRWHIINQDLKGMILAFF